MVILERVKGEPSGNKVFKDFVYRLFTPESLEAVNIKFIKKHNDQSKAKMEYQVNSAGVTELTIRGSTFIDSAVCLNRYLEKFGESFSIRDTERKQFPLLDPSQHATKEYFNCSSKIKIRKAFNHDTYLGSITWFSWLRWERLLDWLALHGFNAPFIPHGHEYIQNMLYKKFEIYDPMFLSGAAFLPHQRTGKIKSFGGPLSDHWIAHQVELGRKIISRAIELDMKPILPTFSGLVPESIISSPYKNASTIQSQSFGSLSLSNSCNLFIKLDDPLFKQMFDSYLEFQSHFFEYEPQFYHFNIEERHVVTDWSNDGPNDHLRETVNSLLPEESQFIVQADDCPKIYGLFENNDDIIFVVSSSSTDHGDSGILESAPVSTRTQTVQTRTIRAINVNENMKTIDEDFKINPFGFELELNLDTENELTYDFVSFLAYSSDNEDHSRHFLENWVMARYNFAQDTTDQSQLMTIKLGKIFEALDLVEPDSQASILAQTPSLKISRNLNHVNRPRDIINAWKKWMEVEPHTSLLSNKNFKKDSITLTVSALESIFERSFISIQDNCRKTDMIKYNCDSFAGDCTNELISLVDRLVDILSLESSFILEGVIQSAKAQAMDTDEEILFEQTIKTSLVSNQLIESSKHVNNGLYAEMIPMCSRRWKIFFDKMKLLGCSSGELSASHDFDVISSEFKSSNDPILLNGNSYWSELKSVQNHYFSKITKNQRSKMPILNRDDVKESFDMELVFIMIVSTIMAFAFLKLLISRRHRYRMIRKVSTLIKKP